MVQGNSVVCGISACFLSQKQSLHQHTAILSHAVREQWEKITDFSESTNPATATDSTRSLIGVLSTLDGGIGDKKKSSGPPSSAAGSSGVNVVS